MRWAKKAQKPSGIMGPSLTTGTASPGLSSLICLMAKGTHACKISPQQKPADLWSADEKKRGGARSCSEDYYEEKNERACSLVHQACGRHLRRSTRSGVNTLQQHSLSPYGFLMSSSHSGTLASIMTPVICHLSQFHAISSETQGGLNQQWIYPEEPRR